MFNDWNFKILYNKSNIIPNANFYYFERLHLLQVFDPGEVLYLYESPAGYGLMILRIAAWWIFEYSTLFTLKHYPEKSNFYTPFNLMGTLWYQYHKFPSIFIICPIWDYIHFVAGLLLVLVSFWQLIV